MLKNKVRTGTRSAHGHRSKGQRQGGTWQWGSGDSTFRNKMGLCTPLLRSQITCGVISDPWNERSGEDVVQGIRVRSTEA